MTESHYTFLSLPPGFDIDEAALEQNYLALQRQFHPDRSAAKSVLERQMATQMAVRINDAYQTLRSPLKRAQYLLQLRGVAVNTEAGSMKPAQETLMEIMELQEQIADIVDARNLEAFGSQVKGREQACLEALRGAFSANDDTGAAQQTLRLSYLTKLGEDIRQKAFRSQTQEAKS